MVRPEIKVNLNKTQYTAGGPIATGILMAIVQLKSSAETISSISLTDTEKEDTRFGFGLKFEIAVQIPELIPNEIVAKDDYFGPQSDHLIATFIVSRWKNMIYKEITRLKNTIKELENMTYLGPA